MERIIKSITENLEFVSENFILFSETELLFRKTNENWSKKEILGHLVDSAQNNIRRVIVGQYKLNENIVYDQNNWVKSADYQNYNSIDLLNLFLLLNQYFCRIIKYLPIEKYQNKVDWGINEPELVSLEYLIEDYQKHLQHHIRQIFEKEYSKKFGEL